MYNLIKRYIEKMEKNDVLSFAKNKNIILSADELEFVFLFIKKNWEQVLSNPNMLNLDRYKNNFSEDNFIKIKKLFNEYSAKFKNIL